MFVSSSSRLPNLDQWSWRSFCETIKNEKHHMVAKPIIFGMGRKTENQQVQKIRYDFFVHEQFSQ